MILRQFLHTDPVAISYLFGCGGHAACAVIDPLGDIEPYLRVADETGMQIRFVIDTHVHADHRSAGRSLANAAGAEYVLHAGTEVAFPFHPAKHRDRLPPGKSYWMWYTRPNMCAFLSLTARGPTSRGSP
jgi:hydroxyacylglutathione hydrolase